VLYINIYKPLLFEVTRISKFKKKKLIFHKSSGSFCPFLSFKFCAYLQKELGKFGKLYFSSANLTNFAVLLENFTKKIWYYKIEEKALIRILDIHINNLTLAIKTHDHSMWTKSQIIGYIYVSHKYVRYITHTNTHIYI